MNTYVVSYTQIGPNSLDQELVEAETALSAMRKYLEQFTYTTFSDQEFSRFTNETELASFVYTTLDANINAIDVTNN